jgi:hypothetical protein
MSREFARKSSGDDAGSTSLGSNDPDFAFDSVVVSVFSITTVGDTPPDVASLYYPVYITLWVLPGCVFALYFGPELVAENDDETNTNQATTQT